MSIIDAMRCDQCGKTADRTKKQENGWRTLLTLGDAGGLRTRQHETGPHFCSWPCIRDYAQEVISHWNDPFIVPEPEPEPEPAVAG